jgi:hypothetical protein
MTTHPHTDTTPFDELLLDGTIFVSVAELARDPRFNRLDLNDVATMAAGSWVTSANRLVGRDVLVVVDGDYSVLGVFHVHDFDRTRQDGDRYYKVDFEITPDEERNKSIRGLSLPAHLRRKRGQIRGIWFFD